MTPTSRPDFPAVAEIVPHAGSMVLLSRVLSHREDETVCTVEIDQQTLLRDRDGSVAAWIGLEYMAQCIAAHAGLIGRAAGEPPQVGFLLGSRCVSFHTARFRPGQTLAVKATRIRGKARGMVSFDCSLEDSATGALLAEGRINCFVPEPGEALRSRP